MHVHVWCPSSSLISRLHVSQLLAHAGGERGAAVPQHAIRRGSRNVRECECSGMGLFPRLVSSPASEGSFGAGVNSNVGWFGRAALTADSRLSSYTCTELADVVGLS